MRYWEKRTACGRPDKMACALGSAPLFGMIGGPELGHAYGDKAICVRDAPFSSSSNLTRLRRERFKSHLLIWVVRSPWGGDRALGFVTSATAGS